MCRISRRTWGISAGGHSGGGHQVDGCGSSENQHHRALQCYSAITVRLGLGLTVRYSATVLV